MDEAQKNDFSKWKHHLQDEVDAAYLYRRLAQAERDASRREIYLRLVKVEDQHVQQWLKLLREAGEKIATEQQPSLRARLMGWLAQRFGSNFIAPSLLAEEGREVKNYLKLSREMTQPHAREMATLIARESADHAGTLAKMLDRTSEPWHAVSSGGMLRSIVYGFNDGLTANFGLVAGVLGAAVDEKARLLAGVAGMLADALSRGSSGYRAAKSEAEVYAHEIALEREEIRLMPELEAEELALIYQAKGVSPSRAQEMANHMLTSPEQMLQEKIREELEISPATMTPLKDGVVTGVATAWGAMIPVFPFFLFDFAVAIWISFACSMLAHFGVGAARSFFTGRGLWRSGFDMFIVGLGVAAVGYVIGDLMNRFWLGQ
ncbi:MAG: VIT1/CCC1 transporter family protein [candidate division KSB1 bacterium]|nr:VIT1/CCC1 transporter family protein [candidate division KSB1 bacterium]